MEDPVFLLIDNDGNISYAQVNKMRSIKMLRIRIRDDCGIPLNQQCFTCDGMLFSFYILQI